MRKSVLKYFKCISCNEANLKLNKLTYSKKIKGEILSGFIICSACKHKVSSNYGVPNFVTFDENNLIEKQTSRHYGSSWINSDLSGKFSKMDFWHYDELVKISKFPKNQNGLGLEAGCGHGKDSVRLSTSNKNSHIISIDISEGSYVTKRLNNLNIKNITVVRADLSNIPIKDNIID